MNKNFLLSLIMTLVVFSHAQAKENFWMDGKDFPNKRVNKNVQALSPQLYKNISDQVGASVVNISSVQVLKGMQTPFGFRIDPDQLPKGKDNPLAPFFGDDFFDQFFGGGGQQPRERKQASLGSGFVLNHEGYIVTNNHVVSKAEDIRVTFVDETEMPVEIVGVDPKTDVALLKIKGSKKVQPVLLGSSKEASVGDIAVAIGNPFGLSHSVTQGIISAKERTIGLGPYDDFIQTDASINPGNSGGPLLNIHGEVIGINTAIDARGQGIGFAIPIDMAKDVLGRLKQDGQVIRARLGVRVQEVQAEHVKALGLKGKSGALVMEVMKDTPASKAKIEPGDVILTFDGKKVKNWNSLPLLVSRTDVGRRVKVELVRNKKPKSVYVVVDRLEDLQASRSTQKSDQPGFKDPMGLKVIDLNQGVRDQLKLPENQKGVMVADVTAGSSAAKQGVRNGDVILRLNRVLVDDLKDYKKISGKIKKGDSVLMLILRDGRKIFIAFTLES